MHKINFSLIIGSVIFAVGLIMASVYGLQNNKARLASDNDKLLAQIVDLTASAPSISSATSTQVLTPTASTTILKVDIAGNNAAVVNSLQTQLNSMLAELKNLQDKVAVASDEQEIFSYTWDHDLYYGMRDDIDVRALQNALMLEGVYKGPVTGDFLSLTRKAVIEFQKKQNFTVVPDTGYVGPYTIQVLNNIYSKQPQLSEDQG